MIIVLHRWVNTVFVTVNPVDNSSPNHALLDREDTYNMLGIAVGTKYKVSANKLKGSLKLTKVKTKRMLGDPYSVYESESGIRIGLCDFHLSKYFKDKIPEAIYYREIKQQR